MAKSSTTRRRRIPCDETVQTGHAAGLLCEAKAKHVVVRPGQPPLFVCGNHRRQFHPSCVYELVPS